MELWERDAALDLLDELLHAVTGGGRLALVAGEAGAGKSSLVAELARRSRPRARVLWGACDRLVTPRALGPLHDIGRQTGGTDPAVRNGYQNIAVRFTVKGDAPAEQLRALVEQSRARSAVFDVITNGVPVTIDVSTD